MRWRALLAAAVLALAAGAALAQATAWDVVWRSDSATAGTSVVGRAHTMAVEDGKKRSATALVRAAGGKVRFDYEGRRRRWSVIDDGRNLIHLNPPARTALVLPRPSLALDRALAERNYVARDAGEAPVAGRPTRLVDIAPRRKGPVARRLWLDRETSFALKRERYNAEGRLTSATEYEEVDFGAPVPPDTFSVPEGWAKLEPGGQGPRLTVHELSARIGFPVSVPRYLPEGYVLLGGYVQEWGRWGIRMAELWYTDGLRVLSVYERPKGEGPPRPGMAHGRGGRHGDRAGRGRGGHPDRGGGRGAPPGRHPRGRGDGRGFGPPGAEVMTLVDRGTEKAVRYFGAELVVVVVGDVTADELVRVAKSVE
jgi:outer membrane lipoprotein-sorting protein